MKALRTKGPFTFLLLMGSLLLPSTWTAAEPDADTRSWMVVLPRSMDAPPETYQVGSLDEGESQQFFTNDGDEIVVSREEKGRVVKVNGKTIRTHFDRNVHVVSKSDDEHHQIHIQKKKVIDGDDEHHYVVRIHEGHDAHVEHEGEEEHETHVEVDEDSTGPVYMQILKSAPHRGVHINGFSVSEEGPTILFIDRM